MIKQNIKRARFPIYFFEKMKIFFFEYFNMRRKYGLKFMSIVCSNHLQQTTDVKHAAILSSSKIHYFFKVSVCFKTFIVLFWVNVYTC